MNLRKITIGICIFWTLIISIITINNEIIIRTGQEVLLRTVPVDPRDLLRGDYVTLAYEIGQQPQDYQYPKNVDVYVSLKLDENNIATISDISNHAPQHKLYLKGKISSCNTTIPLYKNGTCINYGIESYFVKEHKGKELEQQLSKGALVKVAIDKRGLAKIKGFIDTQK